MFTLSSSCNTRAAEFLLPFGRPRFRTGWFERLWVGGVPMDGLPVRPVIVEALGGRPRGRFEVGFVIESSSGPRFDCVSFDLSLLLLRLRASDLGSPFCRLEGR